MRLTGSSRYLGCALRVGQPNSGECRPYRVVHPLSCRHIVDECEVDPADLCAEQRYDHLGPEPQMQHQQLGLSASRPRVPGAGNKREELEMGGGLWRIEPLVSQRPVARREVDGTGSTTPPGGGLQRQDIG